MPNSSPTPSTVEKIGSLSECIIHAQSQGFVNEYKVLPTDQATHDGKLTYSVDDIKLINHFHFSGYSNGLEISTLWMIEDSSGNKGIIINAKSTVAHSRTIKFINQIKDRTPKKPETALIPRMMQLFFSL